MIGKTIKAALTANSALMALVPATKIFPYAANENTDMPMIVYTIDSVSPDYNKGGWANDEVVFSIYSSATDYPVLQTIVSAIRTALELYKVGAGTQEIGQITMISFQEDVIPDFTGFYNKLTFKVTVNTY